MREWSEQNIESLFGEDDIISVYSDRQAVGDGILFDVEELSRIAPMVQWGRGAFQYVTSNLCYTKGYLVDGKPLVVDPFLDWFRPIGKVVKHAPPDHFSEAHVDFPDGTSGEVYAVQNESGRYTAMLPEYY